MYTLEVEVEIQHRRDVGSVSLGKEVRRCDDGANELRSTDCQWDAYLEYIFRRLTSPELCVMLLWMLVIERSEVKGFSRETIDEALIAVLTPVSRGRMM